MSFFEVRSSKADAEELMLRISQELQRSEERVDRLSPGFADTASGSEVTDVRMRLRELNAHGIVKSDEIIHSTRPGVGPLIIRFQRLVRRLTWWYLNPIVDQINAFNNSAVRFLEALPVNDGLVGRNRPSTPPARSLTESSVTRSSEEVFVLDSSAAGPAADSKELDRRGADGVANLSEEVQVIRRQLDLLIRRLEYLENAPEGGHRSC